MIRFFLHACFIVSIFLVTVILTAATVSAEPLDTWHWRNPLPKGSTIYGVTYGNGMFVAVGVDGTILTSQEGGSSDGTSWLTRTSGTTEGLFEVAYGNGRFVAVGYGGAIVTSNDGYSWSAAVSGVSTGLNGVTFGNGTFVAVGDEGVILTSTDGATWAVRSSGTTARLNAVAFGNGTFVAVGDQDVAALSADGATWTMHTTGTEYGWWSGITFGKGMFVAVDPLNGFISSTDGIAWTRDAKQTVGNMIRKVTYGNGIFVAVGVGMTVSFDGKLWRHADASPSNYLFTVAAGEGAFVAGGEEGIFSSNDGDHWQSALAGAGEETIYAVAEGNGRIVAVSGFDGTCVTSPDGRTWHRSATKAAKMPTGIAYGAGTFVATGLNSISSSTDGESWSERFNDSNISVQDVVYGGGKFVAIGWNASYHEIAMTSADGVSWTEVPVSSGPELIAVTWGDGKFVAVGFHSVATSPDGITWTVQYLPTSVGRISGVAWGNGIYVAVGYEGSIITSPDAVNWTIRVPEAWDREMTAVAFGGGRFVAVGNGYGGDKSVYASSDGITWNQLPVPGESWSDAVYTNGTFLIVGRGGKIIQSDPLGTPCETVFFQLPVETFVAAPSDVIMSVTAAAGCAWNAVSNSDWITAAGEGSGNGTVSIAVFNNTGAPRSGSITVAGRSFTIRQSDARYFVSGSSGGNGTIACTYPVAEGASSVCTVLPAAGYAASSLTDNGADVLVDLHGGVYTLTGIHDHHQLAVTFTPDTEAPVITALSLPEKYATQTVPVLSFVAEDNGVVAGYCLTESDDASGCEWSVAPAPYTFSSEGSKVVYGFVRDGAGNISSGFPAAARIIHDSPEEGPPEGWQQVADGLMSNGHHVTSVAYGHERFVASGGGTIVCSGDGTAWTPCVPEITSGLGRVMYGNGRFLVTASGGVLLSSDGINWTIQELPFPLQSAAFGNGLFLATSSDDGIFTSSDGTGWTRKATLPDGFAGRVAYGNNIFVLVSPGFPATTGSAILSSSDGSSWTEQGGAQYPGVEYIVFGSGRFVAAGYGGIITSSDGASWKSSYAPASGPVTALAYGDGVFLAVIGGSIFSSHDGVIWNFNGRFSTSISSFAYGDGTFVAAGYEGEVFRSLAPEKPIVTVFAIPANVTSLQVPITSFTATDNVGVTGYLITTESLAPTADAAGWAATPPANVTAAGEGTFTFYAWARDAAGYISAPASATVTVRFPDTVAPTVSAFTIPSTSSSLTVPITTLTATDNIGVTGYTITADDRIPAADAPEWSATPPASVTAAGEGSTTFYAWAKDAAGNISAPASVTVTITLPDTTNPAISAFTIPATSSTLAVQVITLSATDNVGVTGYMITASPIAPAADAPDWSATPPATVTAAGEGTTTFYAWARDAAGNISPPVTATVTVTLPDTVAPVVSAFTIPANSATLMVPVTAFAATDDIGVTGYLITESSATPLASGSGWSAEPPASVTFSTVGTRTAYAWAKDAAGNVSAAATATAAVVDTVPPSGTISINGGAGFTRDPAVTLTLSAEDDSGSVAGMQFSTDGRKWSDIESYELQKQWTFERTKGERKLYVRYRDAAGNISVPASASIIIDRRPPRLTVKKLPLFSYGATFGFGGEIEKGAAVQVTCPTAQVERAEANDGEWSATATMLSEGNHEFLVTAVDAAGNATRRTFSMMYDTTPPVGQITFFSGDRAGSRVGLLSVSASDNVSGVRSMRFSNDGVNWSRWTPYSSWKWWTLPAGTGEKTMYAQFRDTVGNVSVPTSAHIVRQRWQ